MCEYTGRHRDTPPPPHTRGKALTRLMELHADVAAFLTLSSIDGGFE